MVPLVEPINLAEAVPPVIVVVPVTVKPLPITTLPLASSDRFAAPVFAAFVIVSHFTVATIADL
jgi:hypothetical protein